MDSKQSQDMIITEMNYYFSDYNLLMDGFMKQTIDKHNGWIPIETLLTFKRLKALINCDKNLLINCMKNSDLIEMNENQTEMRRKTDKPLPQMTEQYLKDRDLRTVHINGFPEDSTFDELMIWCKQYGSVEWLQMRRYFKTKLFKGCIFVVFKDNSSADELIGRQILEFNGIELKKENKIQYYLRKKEFLIKLKEMKKIKKDLKQKLSITSKANNCSVCEPNDQLMYESSDGIKTESNETKSDVIRVESAVLQLKGLPKQMPYTKVKQLFSKYAKVRYFNKPNKKGKSFILFKNRFDAKKALICIRSENENQSEIVIDGHKVKAEVLTGFREKRYWFRNNPKMEKHLKRKISAKMAKRSAEIEPENGIKRRKTDGPESVDNKSTDVIMQ